MSRFWLDTVTSSSTVTPSHVVVLRHQEGCAPDRLDGAAFDLEAGAQFVAGEPLKVVPVFCSTPCSKRKFASVSSNVARSTRSNVPPTLKVLSLAVMVSSLVQTPRSASVPPPVTAMMPSFVQAERTNSSVKPPVPSRLSEPSLPPGR